MIADPSIGKFLHVADGGMRARYNGSSCGTLPQDRTGYNLRFAGVHSLPEPAYRADAKTTFRPLSLGTRSRWSIARTGIFVRGQPIFSRAREDSWDRSCPSRKKDDVEENARVSRQTDRVRRHESTGDSSWRTNYYKTRGAAFTVVDESRRNQTNFTEFTKPIKFRSLTPITFRLFARGRINFREKSSALSGK